MITVTEHTLEQLGFDCSSPISAVKTAREMIVDGEVVNPAKGAQLINELLGTDLIAADLREGMTNDKYSGSWELMVVQAVAEAVVRQRGTAIDEADLLIAARARVAALCTAPLNQCWFARAEAQDSTGSGIVVGAVGTEVKVAATTDGKIKKGGKEVLAVELYKKYVSDLNGAPYDNQTFIKILIKQLDMTKAGATTYNYNMKKKFGGQIIAKPKK